MSRPRIQDAGIRGLVALLVRRSGFAWGYLSLTPKGGAWQHPVNPKSRPLWIRIQILFLYRTVQVPLTTPNGHEGSVCLL